MDFLINTRSVGQLLMGLLFLLLTTACQQDYLPADLVRYVQDKSSGLKQNAEVDGWEIEVQYQPISYLIANEFRSNTISPAAFQKRYDELEGLQYYTLKIGRQDGRDNVTTYQVKDDNHRQQRLYYLSYILKEDIHLVQGEESLKPVLCHFERSYDLTNHRTFVLAFKQGEISTDRSFSLHSTELDIEALNVIFQEDKIQNTPTIKLQ